VTVTERRVVIIGSGPAGLTAAIYTARAALLPLVIEGELSSTCDQPGGQLMLTTDVENYPGFADGIMGPDLMKSMRRQAERFGAEFITAKVTKVDFARSPIALWTSLDPGPDPDLEADAVIVATGAQSIMLGVPGEERLIGRGVSTCATCDGFFFRNKEIVVVGGGDSALEEAIFLTKFSHKVTVVHRRDTLRASKIMQQRAVANDRIHFMWNSVVEEVLGDRVLTGVVVRDLLSGELTTLEVDGLFVEIGHKPNTDVFKNHLLMDVAGYVVTHDGTHTSAEGVFAAGDVQDHHYRQAVTAAGSGCMAAIDVERWLASASEAVQA
jgi:thioredoxin reductase (NADPH)